MDDPIEIVARALFEQHEARKAKVDDRIKPRAWGEVDAKERTEVWGAMARAALLALREPTEGMVDAAVGKWITLYRAFEGEKPQPTAGQVVEAIFHGAIDHALQTQGEGE